ncbi:threonine synthase [Mycolicibacterium aubagnense]|uniref:threonine synthase n=1 Tax=Mycolicibacterium aubagnense TaxID=319707 RepID=UPI0010FD5FBB|nr:threonine synthase [Mycolicibacterium aubagnense]TLH60137.1 pyridoxal-5'-phosphate-dependent protein subunit beta [Mycolicibacterium aubagnense]WGI35455.1 threonine synthase [Mycolicibacterium aubagnense]
MPASSHGPILIDRTGRRYPADQPRWRGDDGTPLVFEPLSGIGRQQIDTAINSQWRYRSALPNPLAHIDPVTLGEGRTPLITRTFDGIDVGLKVESMNPTGSFKDRGVSVMVTAVRHQGIDRVLEDSSGNGGSSVAAYCATAGIEANILVPAATSSNKIIQSRLHGANIELVSGTRQAVADEAVRRAETCFYASHNWHPHFLQGVKLIAYEIWEDLGFRAPTAVLVPAGAGSLVLGCAIGFGELHRAGAIDRVPRILVSQPRNCCPLVTAMEQGRQEVLEQSWSTTSAEGTAIAKPVRDREVLQAIRGSGGAAVAVPEDELLPAVGELARLGLFVEPTSAQIVPALRRLRTAGEIDTADTIVAVLTGSGLKAGHLLATV